MIAPPTLSDVLAFDDEHARGELQGRPRRYLAQAQVAAADETHRLAELLESMWPDDGFRANIRREGDQWILDPRVHAIFVLAPAVNLPIGADRWADVATSGLAFSDQTQWLRDRYSLEGVQQAARVDVTDVRTWEQIVSAVPDDIDLPNELIAAMVERMRTLDRDDDILFLRHIGRRLAEAGQTDALRELIGVDERFAAELMPALAATGDVTAIRALLETLAADLDAGGSADHLELEWLNGARDPGLLEPLFNCLRAALGTAGDGPLGAVPSLISTIRRVGGVEAVRRYDELIASSDKSSFKFMRRSRDEVAEDVLEAAGQRDAPAAAAALALPYLGTGGPPETH